MGINRRGFLKVSGLTAIGLAGGSVSKAFGNEDSTQAAATPAPEAGPSGPLTASRWAMVIDVRKCAEKMIKMGVDGIITNYPDRALELLDG